MEDKIVSITKGKQQIEDKKENEYILSLLMNRDFDALEEYNSRQCTNMDKEKMDQYMLLCKYASAIYEKLGSFLHKNIRYKYPSQFSRTGYVCISFDAIDVSGNHRDVFAKLFTLSDSVDVSFGLKQKLKDDNDDLESLPMSMFEIRFTFYVEKVFRDF